MRLLALIRLRNTLLPCHTSAGWRLTGAISVIFVGMAACGPTTPDNNAARGSGAATHAPLTAQAAGLEEPGRMTRERAAELNHATAKRDGREFPGVPELVLQDLDSRDPYTRLRALDHWTTKSTTASFDPVFEAMEDQDEAVRARATAIVEQQWAIEQEQEKD